MKGIVVDERLPKSLRDAVTPVRPFLGKRDVDLIKDMRNTIQHLDERLAKNQIVEGENIWLTFAELEEGPETPAVRRKDEVILDCIVIGKDSIPLIDLVGWLNAMGDCAHAISSNIVPVLFSDTKKPGLA